MLIDLHAYRAAREHALINESEQKAAIFFSNGTEKLMVSPSYDGATEEFAWIIPVPSRPKVEIVDGAIFHELAALTAPMLLSPPPSAESSGRKLATVQVLERKIVGHYDVSVLSSSDPDALMKWLGSNGYQLPDKAIDPIKEYIKRHWTFVACKVTDSDRKPSKA